MARKHALIEQLDGSVDLSEDSRDVDHDEEIEQYLKTGKLGVHNLAWDRLLEWLLPNKEEKVKQEKKHWKEYMEKDLIQDSGLGMKCTQ